MVRRMQDGLRKGAVAVGLGPSYTAAATQWEVLRSLPALRLATVSPCTSAHSRRHRGPREEVIAGSAITGYPLHVVHINSWVWREFRDAAIITEAQWRSIDVTTEAYPYAAVAGIESELRRVGELAERTAARHARMAGHRRAAGGRDIREVPQDWQTVIGHSNTDEMVAVAINSPITAIASDGYMSNGIGHPRTSGTYSRVLGHYVREGGSLSLMDALRKMTLMPAQRLRGARPGDAERRPRAHSGQLLT